MGDSAAPAGVLADVKMAAARAAARRTARECMASFQVIGISRGMLKRRVALARPLVTTGGRGPAVGSAADRHLHGAGGGREPWVAGVAHDLRAEGVHLDAARRVEP